MYPAYAIPIFMYHAYIYVYPGQCRKTDARSALRYKTTMAVPAKVPQGDLKAYLTSIPTFSAAKMVRKGLEIKKPYVIHTRVPDVELGLGDTFVRQDDCPTRAGVWVARDLLVCNGLGNCERKCGGRGRCVEGMYH
jgi:hypothetical protein